jgi:RimJ/RimL family protein N-acetyltransferase
MIMSKINAMTIEIKDGGSVLIREAGAGDAAALLEYVERVSAESDYLTFAPGEFELTVEQEEIFLEESQLSDNKLYIIALLDDDLVGALSFAAGSRSRVRHSGELAMSVRNEQWGKGVGSALIDVLIDWARNSGVITKLNLRVRIDNLAAVHLYQKKGFTEEGLIRKAIRIDDTYHDLYWMGLVL